MTNGENVTRIVEQNEDFCILTDDVAGTVTIEVSLDWWNQPKTEVLDKIRAEIESMDFDFGDYYDHTDEIIDMVCKVIDKYKGESED